MIFHATFIEGAYVVEMDHYMDPRGFFARVFCDREFAAAGLTPHFVQANFSHNELKGTLRGLHLQKPPHGEAKLVRCVQGAVFDVLVDLRPSSPTYLRWYGTELSHTNRLSLYIPEGCAHGFQALRDQTDILYLVSAHFEPSSEAGFRHDDPAFGIQWPLPVGRISAKDTYWPLYRGKEAQTE